MKKFTIIITILSCVVNFTFAQDNVSGPLVQTPVYFDISPPLREMVKVLPGKSDRSWKDGIVKNQINFRPRPDAAISGGMTDPNLQTANGVLVTDTTIMNFEGNYNMEGVYPPDTHGDVGPNHYFQVVNSHFSIYNKAGVKLVGPLLNSSIFTGLPNNSNSGDAIVLYDEQADRWLFSQFSLPTFPNGPFFQMVAVSQTGDPTGTWFRYQYSFTDMPDYPKFGVWGDGYYMSINRFTSGSTNWAGAGAVAFNRSLMLAGNPAPNMVMFTKPAADEAGSLLPSDCDGPFPTGNPPNYFIYSVDGAPASDHLGMYEFHVDWVNPANSTFTNFLSLPVNSFSTNVYSMTQPGTAVKLDGLNDRMMYRLQYRKFAGYETMVCNHTIDATATVAGIRWYELRKTTGAWSIYQQGTYAPADNNNRWMASIAMDSSGNIAMGYSISGSSMFPSIRYTGRKKNDAMNQMTIAEKGIFNGTGSQTGSAARWGDYSAMSIDPSAKATFWYTTEYLVTTSAVGWTTRIASFRLADNPSVATLEPTAIAPTSATLNGTVNPNGLATTYNFQYGLTTGYGSATTPASAGLGNSTLPVNSNLTGLIAGSTYHYRLVAINSDGTSNGNDITFIAGAATVSTTAASMIGFYTATSGGNITAAGGSAITARGVCWGAAANPTIAGSHTTDASGTGVFTSSITGLSAHTTYHVRAYATNTAGTFYGDDLTFTTACDTYSLPFTESFTNTTIPNCWTQVDHQGNGQVWQFGIITGQSPNPVITGNYAFLNSDGYGNGNSQNADLVTPTLDLTGYSAVNLAFSHYFKSYAGSSGSVSYSIDNGTTWTLISTITATSASNPVAFSQAVAEVAGQSQVKFKWNYIGVWAWYWAIDDINITGTCTPVAVSVSISRSANSVCAGTPVTFTATPTNGGEYPGFQWKVNGTNAGTNSATFTYVPANNNVVTCVLTSSSVCVTASTATSNSLAMTVNPGPAVSISISASANPVCAGTTVTYNSAIVNGGSSPAYQWKVSGITINGATNASYSLTPSNNHAISCVLTSNSTCMSGNPATSNVITMAVNPLLPVSVSISASVNPVVAGTPVTFTASPVNGGASPVYQWKVNGTNGGTNSNSFTYTPSSGDQVSCMLTSGSLCVTTNPANSNTITMAVNGMSSIANLQNVNVTNTQCYNASQTIIVAGSGNYFKVFNGGSATMIAGQNILFHPGTVVVPGGYLHGYISPGGPWCAPPPFAAVLTGENDISTGLDKQFYRIYPNPTTGEFMVDLNASETSDKWLVEIYDMKGERMISEQIAGERKHEFSLSGKPAGIYLIRVIGERNSGTTRIIKQ